MSTSNGCDMVGGGRAGSWSGRRVTFAAGYRFDLATPWRRQGTICGLTSGVTVSVSKILSIFVPQMKTLTTRKLSTVGGLIRVHARRG